MRFKHGERHFQVLANMENLKHVHLLFSLAFSTYACHISIASAIIWRWENCVESIVEAGHVPFLQVRTLLRFLRRLNLPTGATSCALTINSTSSLVHMFSTASFPNITDMALTWRGTLFWLIFISLSYFVWCKSCDLTSWVAPTSKFLVICLV